MFVQVRTEPKHRSTQISKYQSIEHESYEHDETSLTIFPCVLGSAFPIIRVCSGLSFVTKGLGHLAIVYLFLLLVTRYNLSYHKTICYHLFQYLQRIPCWKPLIISFFSSLSSTLLLIERTTIDPLYLWVINTLFWRRSRGVKRLW